MDIFRATPFTADPINGISYQITLSEEEFRILSRFFKRHEAELVEFSGIKINRLNTL